MIYPSSDRVEDQGESRYTLVVLAAKRAKQLREGAQKLIETRSTNPLTIAMEEIAAGKVISRVPSHDEIPARGFETEMEALPEIESAAEEAAELIAAPIDEAARVAELLKLPSTDEESTDEAIDEQMETAPDAEIAIEAESVVETALETEAITDSLIESEEESKAGENSETEQIEES